MHSFSSSARFQTRLRHDVDEQLPTPSTSSQCPSPSTDESEPSSSALQKALPSEMLGEVLYLSHFLPPKGEEYCLPAIEKKMSKSSTSAGSAAKTPKYKLWDKEEWEHFFVEEGVDPAEVEHLAEKFVEEKCSRESAGDLNERHLKEMQIPIGMRATILRIFKNKSVAPIAPTFVPVPGSAEIAPAVLAGVQHFLLEVEPEVCITVLAKRAAITFAHCLYADSDTPEFKGDDHIGDPFVVKPYKGSPMLSFPNGEEETTLKVAYVNGTIDFVLLVSRIDLCIDSPLLKEPVLGQRYVLLGLSAEDRDYTDKISNIPVNAPLCVKDGIVASDVFDDKKKYLGHSGMNPGDSGGGLYTYDGQLIGIAVEFDNEPGSGVSMLHFIPVKLIFYEIEVHGYNVSELDKFSGDAYPERMSRPPVRARAH